MRYTLLACLFSAFFFSCNNSEKAPDVTDVKIEISTQRFEQDLFKTDTLRLSAQLDQLQAKYPSFGENFFGMILNVDPTWSEDSAAKYVHGFLAAYKPVFDTAQVVFRDFSPYEKSIREGLQYMKYYFPQYHIPKHIITYIGPLDGYGDILSDDAIIVGLHQHLGKDFSLYKNPLLQETYPEYITNRFEPGYIPVNAMKNIILDTFPEKMEDKSLVLQMVEKGKRLYLLSKLLPNTEEYKLIGYTAQQLKDVYEHEKAVWDLFVQNNFLQTIDNNIIKNYIGEGPKTQELGEASPGNIGSFAGWQIVKKYMEKFPSTKLGNLIATDPETIFSEAKYKP